MKRIFDFVLALVFLIIFTPLILVLSVLVWFEDGASPLYWSSRVGVNGKLFNMPKIRSMRINTPQLATDKLDCPTDHITSMGHLLRKTSLDELPQLYSILMGKMSFVGPRPALFNQHNLIEARQRFSIDTLKPGLTGWAQVNGRDDLNDDEKISLDLFYLKNQTFFLDLYILWRTFLVVVQRQNISH